MISKHQDAIAFSGSFDPFTKGHEEMVKLALSLEYSKVIIIISDNKDKKTLLPKKSRIEIINYFININNLNHKVSIETHDSSSYLVDFVESLGCKSILRGFRDQIDHDYEEKIKKINYVINPKVETVILKSPKDVSHISSSVVKSIIGYLGFEKTLIKMVNQVAYKLLINFHYKPVLEKIIEDNETIDLILNHYGEPHRFYHGVNHVIDLFEKLSLFELSEFEKSILSKAIVYHDIIYNPISSTNEDDSAKLYQHHHKNSQDQVTKMILATKSHSLSPEGEDHLLDIFLDLDLSILGEDKLKFQVYEDCIREEYLMIPESVYNEKRNEIMKRLKGSYRTEIGRKLWNSNRNSNLRKY